MNKKGLSTLVFGLLTLSLVLSACGTNQTNNAATPASDNGAKGDEAPVKELRIMAGVVGGKTPEETELFEKEIERLTGIKVDINKPASDYDTKLTAAISSGEKYDLLQISKEKMNIFIEQGILTPLTDFVEGSEVLSDIPSNEWEQVKTKDGQIYGVFSKFQGGTMPIVRQDWLDKLKLKAPTTLDEFYTVLKAFKEQDPDGNGKADTYGLSTAGLYEIQGFMSAAGLKQRYVMEGDKRVIPYATEAAVPVYEWFAKIYKEGILDPNFATNDSGKMRDLFLTDRVGMVTYWDAWVGLFNNTRLQEDPNTTFQAKGIPGPAGPDGTILLRRGDPDVWVIPVNAEHPETAKQFMDWWHTEPGIILGSLGIEGEDYSVNDGKYELTETGKDHGMDHGVPFWYNQNVKPPFGNLPGVDDAQKIIVEHATVELTPPGWTDAEKILNNYAIKAMTGEMPAAEAVQKMHNELKAANLID
ncbi:putative aldouronate transport system substrate-binding protein [Paenibacillus endophyticus]|uniref:Putative aldouronate transport system substrate-binding protein n=1 Tax=Paenibacillus endophyticus TaxID=1294268 RepID=A0A7W5CE46_9BACL|nr:extracellular solute-binding protein [Paenibacillus endophyticus]MBB3155565.1 putative aldouronate transport system substrate-binding protein [Paenibacillus endophyticus]